MNYKACSIDRALHIALNTLGGVAILCFAAIIYLESLC